MIQEMSLDLFGERFAVFTPKPSAEDIKLAEALAADAAGHRAEAEKQREYAEMARTLITGTEDDSNRRELARIAVWHYERSAACFRRAHLSFESAAKIQNAEIARRRLLKKAETMAEFAGRAELAALELGQGVKLKTGGLNNETG